MCEITCELTWNKFQCSRAHISPGHREFQQESRVGAQDERKRGQGLLRCEARSLFALRSILQSSLDKAFLTAQEAVQGQK